MNNSEIKYNKLTNDYTYNENQTLDGTKVIINLWNKDENYSINSYVLYNNVYYISKRANKNIIPTVGDDWGIASIKTVQLTQKLSYSDYTDKDIKQILSLDVLNDPTYITYHTLQDNEKIEGVSYNLYGSTDYWDILVLINEIDPLFDMPYDFDIITNMATSNVDNYSSKVYATKDLKTLNPIRYNELIQEEITRITAYFEKIRTIKIIKPSKMLDFIDILKRNGF